jgi:hypothetical protein
MADDKKSTGVTCTKFFKVTISKKFPDDTLAVQAFGTTMEATCDNVEDEARLFDRVYNSTGRDMQRAYHIDPITKSLNTTVNKCLKKEQTVAESLKKKEG